MSQADATGTSTFRPDPFVSPKAVLEFCTSTDDKLTAIPYVDDRTATWLREQGDVHSVTQVLKKFASYAQEGKGTLEVCGAFYEWLVSLQGSSTYAIWLNYITTAVYTKARTKRCLTIRMQDLWDALDDVDNADRGPLIVFSDPSGGAAAGAGAGAARVTMARRKTW